MVPAQWRCQGFEVFCLNVKLFGANAKTRVVLGRIVAQQTAVVDTHAHRVVALHT